MSGERDRFKSSYGSFVARQRQLERSRARHDALDGAVPATPATTPDDAAAPAAGPSPARR